MTANVSELFQSTILQAEGPEAPEPGTGETCFGFTAATPGGLLLARWNANYVNCFQGRSVTEKEVALAFGPLPRN
jgi:hypothetical protein